MLDRALITIFLVAAAPLTSAAGQSDRRLVDDLLKLNHAAAVREISRRPAEVKDALEALKTRFDNSIHSARDMPVQRTVEFDATTLREGLALAGLYNEATRDDRPLRLFNARQTRIDGTVLLNQRKYAAAIEKLDSALAEAQRLDDVWLEIITDINRAYGYIELGQMSVALEACERARRLADRSDPRSRALAVFNLASVHMHMGHFATAIPIASEASMLSQQIKNKLWEGNARLNLGVAYFQTNQMDQARLALTAARDVLLTTQDKLGIGRSYYNLALVAASVGDHQEAVREMERALPLIRTVDIRHSHEIEEEPAAYFNSIEEASLRLLSDWHGRLGHQEQARDYATSLEALRARRPARAEAEHDHKDDE